MIRFRDKPEIWVFLMNRERKDQFVLVYYDKICSLMANGFMVNLHFRKLASDHDHVACLFVCV